MMRLKAYSILILCCLFSIVSYGQYSLSGTVLDGEVNKTIGNAEVFNKEVGRLVRTDAKGKFAFQDLPAGKYTLVVFVTGYNVLEQVFDLDENTLTQLELQPYSDELSEVVISQKREEVFRLNRLNPVEGTAIYAGKKSEVILVDQIVGNVSANNARQIYSQVVGLNIYENGDAGLQLNVGGRGLDPNRTSNFNTRQNGYDISADVLGYPESYYTPPAEALSQIEVVRGAASLQYGTQFGGLLNFKFKNPNPVKKLEWISRQSYGSFNLFTSFNSISGTVGKFSYYTYLNYKQGDGFRPNSAFESKNHFASLNYDFGNNTSLTFESTYLNYLAEQAGGLTDTQFNQDINQSNRDRNWFSVDWHLFALKFKKKISYKTDFSLNLFGLDAQRDALGFRGDPRDPQSNPMTAIDDPNSITRDLIQGHFNNWGAESRILTRYKLGQKDAVFLIGSKYYQSKNTYRQGPGTNGSDSNFSFTNIDFPNYPNQADFDLPNFNLAFFAENIFFVTDKFSLTPGFRYEYIRTESEGDYVELGFDGAGEVISRLDTSDNRSFNRAIALFGLGASHQYSESLELYANISQNYRSVTFSDIRVVNPSFIIDANISDERGFTSDIGIRGKWRKKLSFDVSGFIINYNDRIGTILVGEGPDKGDRVRKNIGDAFIYGFESFIEWNTLKNGDIEQQWFTLNPFLNLAITQSQYLNSEENNVKGKMVEFIPLINLKTGVRFGYKNFLGNLQFTHLSKQYTDAENSQVPETGDSREGTIGEIPAYSIMDLSLSYRFRQFTLETGSNNLLNEKYFTRRATGYPGPGIIPSDPRSFYVALEVKL